MYAESELLPLSGLQHLLYCERQWALIHIEQQWAENRFTADGRVLHRVVDESPDESHSGMRIVRSLDLRSRRLGIAGRADVVLFPLSGDGPPMPVEFKRGRPKPADWDEVQLCAQALCLEEMLNVSIPQGSLFYGEPRGGALLCRSLPIFANAQNGPARACTSSIAPAYRPRRSTSLESATAARCSTCASPSPWARNARLDSSTPRSAAA